MPQLNYEFLTSLLKSKLIKRNFQEDDAELCAKIFVDNSLFGVESHGINRFPLFIRMIDEGLIKVDAKPKLLSSFNAVQQWEGNMGPGPLNAWTMTEKVIELAKEYGIGCIGLRNNNHWMRPGAYGWKAAEEGYIFICWTNAIPNMPPFGSKEPRTGNNPIVFAVPRSGKPVVLDMSLSQFSYGKLETYMLNNQKLPMPGGYDSEGELTDDPEKIYKSKRPLPIGLWKGAGFSLLLDIIAVFLSGGKSTSELHGLDIDSGVSQVFIAIDPSNFIAEELINSKVDEILNYYKGDEEVYYPGERSFQKKERYLVTGIPIAEEILVKIQNC